MLPLHLETDELHIEFMRLGDVEDAQDGSRGAKSYPLCVHLTPRRLAFFGPTVWLGWTSCASSGAGLRSKTAQPQT